jgi:hypothetical protein
VGFVEIFFYDAFDIPRWDCMKVEDVANWNAYWWFFQTGTD